MSFTYRVASRYLWSARGGSFSVILSYLSTAGVAIGVMVLTIVMAVMTGFQSTLREKILSTTSHVVVQNVGGPIQNWQEVSAKIASIDGVESVSAFTYHQALMNIAGGSVGVMVRGIEPQSASAEQLQGYLTAGNAGSVNRLFDPHAVTVFGAAGEEHSAELNGIFVGRALQRMAGLRSGQPVSLLAPSVGSSPFGLVPRYKRFVILGGYRSGLIEFENAVIYMSLADAQNFFRVGSAVTGFEVRVKDVNAAPQLGLQIVDALTQSAAAAGFYAQDWTEMNRPLWEAIQLEKKAYFIVLLLIVIMASFSIISTLIIVVLEKRADIAVFKTLGLSSNRVAWLFFAQGAVIGVFGTALGLVLGILGCEALKRYPFPLDERIFQMTSLPIQVDLFNFLIVGLVSVAICMLATVYPAFRASRLQPTELLRHG